MASGGCRLGSRHACRRRTLHVANRRHRCGVTGHASSLGWPTEVERRAGCVASCLPSTKTDGSTAARIPSHPNTTF